MAYHWFLLFSLRDPVLSLSLSLSPSFNTHVYIHTHVVAFDCCPPVRVVLFAEQADHPGLDMVAVVAGLAVATVVAADTELLAP